jgi:hypothetical protein
MTFRELEQRYGRRIVDHLRVELARVLDRLHGDHSRCHHTSAAEQGPEGQRLPA